MIGEKSLFTSRARNSDAGRSSLDGMSYTASVLLAQWSVLP